GDKDEAVVKAGQEAIAKLGPDAELAVPEMVQVMKKAEGPMLIELLKLLAKVGPNGKTAIADVAALGLKDPTDKELFEETVLTLGKIGPGDLKALYAVSRGPMPAARVGGILALEYACVQAEERRLLLNNLDYRLSTSTANRELDPTVRAVIAEVAARLRKGGKKV